MITIVAGARPQFIKVAAIIRALQRRYPCQLIHTGYHYDDNLYVIMFSDLEIPQPEVDLCVGSGTHGVQTAAMLAGIEPLGYLDMLRIVSSAKMILTDSGGLQKEA